MSSHVYKEQYNTRDEAMKALLENLSFYMRNGNTFKITVIENDAILSGWIE